MLLASALICMATNVYHEARGEPFIGQLAVAQVTMSRAGSSKNVCKTVLKPSQFSWTKNAVVRKNKVPALKKHFVPVDKWAWSKALVAASWTLTGLAPNVVGESKHYHASYVNPKWAEKMKLIATIGGHLFYEET